MKKLFLLAFVSMFALSTSTLTGCSSSQGSQSSGSVTNTVIALIAGMLDQLGRSNTAASLDQQTRVDAVIQGTEMVSAFKNLLSTTYQISKSKVNKAYPNFTTIESVANFVAQNSKKKTPAGS